MPRFDGTGPQGQGALSGRRSGRCEGADNCRGQGRRQRFRNRGCGNFRLIGASQDRSFVESCINRLLAEVTAIQTRINDLKSQIGE